MRGVWGRGLTLPGLPVPWAGSRGPLPTGGWCGWAGVGTRHWLLVAQTLPDIACRASGNRLPGEGSPRRGEGRLGLDAHPPAAARPLRNQSGSAAPVFRGRGVRVWEPGTNPTGTLLRAVVAPCGDGRRRPPQASCFPDGRLGWGATIPRLCVLLGAIGVRCRQAVGAGVWTWGPSTAH